MKRTLVLNFYIDVVFTMFTWKRVLHYDINLMSTVTWFLIVPGSPQGLNVFVLLFPYQQKCDWNSECYCLFFTPYQPWTSLPMNQTIYTKIILYAFLAHISVLCQTVIRCYIPRVATVATIICTLEIRVTCLSTTNVNVTRLDMCFVCDRKILILKCDCCLHYVHRNRTSLLSDDLNHMINHNGSWSCIRCNENNFAFNHIIEDECFFNLCQEMSANIHMEKWQVIKSAFHLN